MSFILEDVDFRYGSLCALRGISAQAEPGTITALIGPNASGKSTLLRLLTGFLSPTRGQVLLRDRVVHEIPPRELATMVAYVPQRSSVSSAFSVREVVELGRYALPADPGRIEGALKTMDMGLLAERPYHALSVGQQQRVMLARVLAQIDDAGCLLLDEPTAALDLRHISLFMSVLKNLAGRGVTVVLAVHDLSLAAAMADRVWMLKEGRLVGAGLLKEVLMVERLEEVFGTAFSWVSMPEDGSRFLVPAVYELHSKQDFTGDAGA